MVSVIDKVISPIMKKSTRTLSKHQQKMTSADVSGPRFSHFGTTFNLNVLVTSRGNSCHACKHLITLFGKYERHITTVHAVLIPLQISLVPSLDRGGLVR